MVPKHILVASPHPAFGELLRSSIEESSRYRVHLTRTGKGLLDSLKDGDCDAVILDSDVSDMAYTQVGLTLLRQYPDLFVLVISPEEDLAILPPANFTPHAFLDRPFYMPDLLTKLDGLFGLGAAYVEPAEKRTPAWVSDPESATRRLQQNLANGPAQGAILFEQSQLIAFAGSLLNEGEANRLVELLLRHWEADARSDLMRYVRPSNRGGEYQLYARTLAGPVVMALVFEYGIPLSQMRSTAQRWARTLEDLTPAGVPDGLTTTYPYTLRAQPSGETEGADEPETLAAAGVSGANSGGEVGPDTILKTVNYFEAAKTAGEAQSDDLLSDDDMGWIDTVEDEEGVGFDPLSLADLLAEMPSPDPERSAAREELARILAQEWNVVDRAEPTQTGDRQNPISGGAASETPPEREISFDHFLNEAAAEPQGSGFSGISPVLDAESPDLNLEELFPDLFSTSQAAAPDLPSTGGAPTAVELPADEFSGLNFLLDPDETPASGDETPAALEMGWLTEAGTPVGETPAVEAGPEAQDAPEASPEAEEVPEDLAADTIADSTPEIVGALSADDSAEEIGPEAPGEEADLPESDSVPTETPAQVVDIPEGGTVSENQFVPFDLSRFSSEMAPEAPALGENIFDASVFGAGAFEDEAAEAAGAEAGAAEASAAEAGGVETLAPEDELSQDGDDDDDGEGTLEDDAAIVRLDSLLSDFAALDKTPAPVEEEPLQTGQNASGLPDWLFSADAEPETAVSEPAASPDETAQEPHPFWFDELISTTPVIPSPAHEAEQAAEAAATASMDAASADEETPVSASESDDLLLPWEQPDSLDWLDHEADTKPVVLSAPAASAGVPVEPLEQEIDIPSEQESPAAGPAEEPGASLEALAQPADDLPTAVDWPLAGDVPEVEAEPLPSVEEASIPAWIESPPPDDATRPVAAGGRPFVLPFVTDEPDLLSPSPAAFAGGEDENNGTPAPSDPLASAAFASLSTEIAPPSDGVAYTCILIPRYEDHRLIADLAGLLESTVPQDCEAFGWYPENVDVKPSYLMWVVQVTSSVSPGNLVRIIRQRTTDRIYQTFPYLHVGSESDFWAPGSLVVRGSQPPDAKNVREFIENTRRRQNGSSS